MFQGVYTALITPFRDGRVDREALGRLLEMQMDAGVSGVVPCGTTGESATLSHDEHREVVRFCVERVQGRIQVIAGAGSNSTRESIELTRFAKEAGADAALLITPYYNKPGQAGLVQHYRAIAEAVDLPLVLYNVPGRTAVDMAVATVEQLALVSNIVAIKDATANLERASLIHKRLGTSMILLSGDDATFMPFLAVGGKGVISVSSNIVPRLMMAIWKAWQEGNPTLARERHETLLDLNQILFCETNPIPIKAAAAMLGMCTPEIRLPLTPLAQGNQEALRRVMQGINLFD